MDAPLGNKEYENRWRSSLMNNYGTPQLTLVRGEGVRVWDADGKEYLDFLSGIGVNALGHSYPAVVDAITGQTQKLGHISNFYANPTTITFAEKILDISGFRQQGKVLFVNSGAEANEAALKVSRLTGKTTIVSCVGSFHGRTMGALSLTGQQSKKDPFLPLLPDIRQIPFGDDDALDNAVDDNTAAVFVEPILGEGGVIPAPTGYLTKIRDITAKHDALMVVDEVQTGTGRTGNWLAFQQENVAPDIITVAKGLGGGLPLGAVIGIGDAAELLQPGQHGTTFGGNPIACAAGLAVLNTIEKENLLNRVVALSKKIQQSLNKIHPLVDIVRGQGFLLGIVLAKPLAKELTQAAQEAGFLINAAQPNVIRLAPPLITESSDIEHFISAFPKLCDLVDGQ